MVLLTYCALLFMMYGMLPTPHPTASIRQGDLPSLLMAHRITQYPAILRTPRMVQGGGFGDQASRPNAWTVVFLVDGKWSEIKSARGPRREWGSLDRVEAWLRQQGFDSFWVRNELDPTGESASGPAD